MEGLISRILLTVIVLLFISSTSQSHLCLTEPRCYCYTYKTGITIICKYVGDVQPINNVLKNYPRVHTLSLSGQYLKYLKSKSFANQSIDILEISGPLGNIADDALAFIKNLEIVSLNGTMFSTIPKGAALSDFRVLEMSNGVLEGIHDELHAMTTTADFMFSNNNISYIAADAFANAFAMTNLDLSHNSLEILNVSVFRQAFNLKRLNLAYNRLLTVDRILNNLNLETLNLYGNNLSDVDNVFNRELYALKWLDLGGNPNLNLSNSTFQNSQKKLMTLGLSNNQFMSLDPDLIKNLNYLHDLHLNGNNLSNIPKDFFAGSKYIRKIVLSSNNFKSMDNLLIFTTPTELPNLESIALNENEISSIKIDSHYQRILYLNLSGNQVAGISEIDFMNLTSIKYLNLSRNPISDVKMGSFERQQKLQSLDLSFTKIKTLNQFLTSLSSLSYLRMTSSSLQSLENEFKGLRNLKKVYLDGNNIMSVTDAFLDIYNLTALNLARNNLTTLMNGSLPTVKLKSHSFQKLWLEDNPLSCDCRLLWMLEWLKNNNSKLQDNPLCHSPSNLHGIAIKDLNETLLVDWNEDCPESCECKCVAAGINISTNVNCSDKELTNKPSVFPRNAKSIDISENKLTAIEFNTADYPELEVLNLEGNKLTDIQVELSSSIEKLYLSRNNLTKIPYENWKNTTLSQITLSVNPWICDCKAWDFRQWLLIHNSSILDLQDIKCGDNGSLKNQVIINLNYGNFCPEKSEKDTYIVIIAIFSVFLLMTCFILYLYRKLLVAIFFECGCQCLKTEEDYDYSFDAFLLFADEDDEFALGVIEEGLETDSRKYRLFVPSRQVLLSSSPLSINSSVADCCKVIVILSSNFLRNSQCMQLMKTAMACSIEKTAQRFIFIITDSIPPELKLDAVLNCLVKRSTLIKWGECLFWTKLKFSLPKKSKTVTSNEEESERLI
ncbi:protein toll-like isoform X1 [Parasteatoda tepidariorum]|uniref:protein toll-like isoform X1 n=1 Tax=Parasteatoda tepidariorum TaxID=114398 RepID=UPI001C719758|nr:protein slit-like isoform X2 [Parasteatoda tepidariorum]